MPDNTAVIVGGGPAGLCCAWYWVQASPANTVVIVERENELGGCHRVTRVEVGGASELLFTEHAPRVYWTNYHHVMAWLHDMGLSWDDYFVRSHYGPLSAIPAVLRGMSMGDMAVLAKHYVRRFLAGNGGYQTMSMAQLCDREHVSARGRETLERLCRITDGAQLDRFAVETFFAIVNQNMLYELHQPRAPLDETLWRDVYDRLMATGRVRFVMGATVRSVGDVDRAATEVLSAATARPTPVKIYAIPPMALAGIICDDRDGPDPVEAMKRAVAVAAARGTEYMPYISMTFHWLETNDGRPDTSRFRFSLSVGEWGVAVNAVSDYWDGNGGEGDEDEEDAAAAAMETVKLVLSCAITLPERPGGSEVGGKTAHECPDSTVVMREAYRQLCAAYPELRDASAPDFMVLSPTVQYDVGRGVYYNTDMAYVRTAQHPESIAPELTDYEHRSYTVGTHNGHSGYAFTSMESAVENAMYVMQNYVFSARSEGAAVTTRKITTLNEVVMVVVMAAVVVLVAMLAFLLIPQSSSSSLHEKPRGAVRGGDLYKK